jgi:organic radical activating enzyme
MDAFYRYFNLLKQSGFGFNLPDGSLLNYLKLRAGAADCRIGVSGKTYPALMSLAVTKRCNLSCSFCAFGKKPDNWQEGELTADKFEKILNLDLLKKSIGVIFTGGEPLLNQDLPQLLNIARKNKKLVCLISNGLLFDENLAKDLKSCGLRDIQISVYDWTKDKLPYILPKISKHIPIFASFVLTKSKLIDGAKNDFNDLINTIAMCKESGCQSLKFSLCTSTVGESPLETINDKNIIYPRFIEICKEKLQNICFRGYQFGGFLPTKKFTLFFPEPVYLTSKKRDCRIPWNLYLDANGNYTICCRLMPALNDKDCLNIFSNGEDAYNSPKVISIRKCLLNPDKPLEKECVGCAYMNSYSQV